MSKQTLNVVNNIVIKAEQRGVAKLIIENQTYDGKNIIYKNENLISFGSYGYLGLEVDERLKKSAIDAINAFGIQYPSSQIYSSLPLYKDLINLLEKIFNSNIVVTTSLSLGHIGVMQTIIHKEDLLILDQHVHSSVQDAAQRLRSKGVKVIVVRHNDLVGLEQKIKEYSNKFEKIWYAIDGIYSMYGDTAPIYEIETLLNKYLNFHLYADDAHGVSCFGKNGSGWILSKIKFHPKLILTTGMAKAFGTMGGVFAIPNNELYSKVKNCTGSLIFSGPLPIPVLAASIESAKIHLSSEVRDKQKELQTKIRYCHELLKKEGIPNLSEKETPIFFIAIGKLNAGYNLVKKMIEDGFLTNLASFPAVSEACTGLRFTITLHHSFCDIERLVESFRNNYPLVLSEENLSVENIRRSFRKVRNFPSFVIEPINKTDKIEFTQEIFKTITKINENDWNNMFPNGNTLNWSSLKLLEKTFKNSNKIEHNWSFYYLIIRDLKNNVVLATFFTIAVLKEDMLAPKLVSEEIELDRKFNPYFLSSRVLMMGTQLSEGNHLYINKESPKWAKAISLLLNIAEKIKEDNNLNTVLLRDFSENDKKHSEIFQAHSYLKVSLPNAHSIKIFKWNSSAEFLESLNKKRRKYIRDKVLSLENEFQLEITSNPNDYQIDICFKLYKNVSNKSMELNTFEFPKELIKNLASHKNWELVSILIQEKGENITVATMLSFVSTDIYYPVLVGLDYKYLNKNIYPQIIWQIINRAKSINKRNLSLGFTASQNKRKFGAEIEKRFAYIKSKDNYNQMLISMYQG